MPATYVEHLCEVIKALGEKEALAFPGISYPYRELDSLIRRTVALLETYAIRPGDRIAIALETSPEAVAFHLASLFLGSIHVPMNPRSTQSEVDYILGQTTARLFVRHTPLSHAGNNRSIDLFSPDEHGRYVLKQRATSLAELLQGFAPASCPPFAAETDVCLMCYTSGTTGRPKGAMLTYGNIHAGVSTLHTAWGWTDKDVLLHTLPLFHIHGLLVALHGALFAGAKVVFEPLFAADLVLERLSRGDSTMFMGVPTMYNRMVKVFNPKDYSLDNVRLLVSGSAPLSLETFYRFKELFGHTLLERYGMTETGIVVSNPLQGQRRPGSVGKPLPGIEVTLRDPTTGARVAVGEVGEILIRGPSVFKGYWMNKEETEACFVDDGWFRSSDLALQDEQGYYYIVGRTKELIITSGFNVYPREVEEVLMRHDRVEEAAVFACADPDLGERVVAAVVPRGNAGLLTPQSVIDHCRTYLAGYKCPKEVYILDKLPRNAMGKVEKGLLPLLVGTGGGHAIVQTKIS